MDTLPQGDCLLEGSTCEADVELSWTHSPNVAVKGHRKLPLSSQDSVRAAANQALKQFGPSADERLGLADSMHSMQVVATRAWSRVAAGLLRPIQLVDLGNEPRLASGSKVQVDGVWAKHKVEGDGLSVFLSDKECILTGL